MEETESIPEPEVTPPSSTSSSASKSVSAKAHKVVVKKEAIAVKRECSVNEDDGSDEGAAPVQTEPDSTHIADPKADMICVVCGDRANGMHYKALTCEGCKTFFRRNARKRDNLKCEMEEKGNCEMDLYMRRHCAFCRMRKCLSVGMQVGRLWDKDRLKTRKPIKKIKPQEDADKPEEAPSESSPTTASKPGLSAEHKELMYSINMAYNESNVRIGELPDRPTTTMAEARKQRNSSSSSDMSVDDNDITRAILASMGSMGESLAMKGQSIPDSERPGGSSGEDGRAQDKDIPGCSSEGSNHPMGSMLAGIFGFQGAGGNPLLSGAGPSQASGGSGEGSEGAGESPFTEAAYKHIMEVCLLVLKQMIAFAKTLPGFLELHCEDQASLVKGTFVEYLILTSGGIFDAQKEKFVSKVMPGESYDINDANLSGFSGMIGQVMHFTEKMIKLQLSEEERAVLYAVCILTPDRPELSNAAKEIVSFNQEVLVEALSASGRVNHSDQPQFFPKCVNLLTELRNCTETFMDNMMQLKLKGNFIQPILGEVLEM